MKKIEKITNEVKNIKTKEIFVKYNSSEFKGKKILTFGTFDLFHIGHKKLIDHCLDICKLNKNLFIGVSSDNWNKLKGKKSYQSEKERIKKIKIEYPKANVFLEEHTFFEETWPNIWDKYNIDLIIMGGDHVKNLSYINNVLTPKGKKMKIIFYERTPKISSEIIKENLSNEKSKL